MQENKKNALGKGLSELISETSIPLSNETNLTGSRLIFLPLNHVVFNTNQPRKTIDHAELDDLTTSIKEHGILQPIIVRQIDKNLYQIIAGERRCHAARKAGLLEIPVIIKEYNECDALEVAIIENVQRKELNAIEESEAYCKLVENYSHTQESLARRLGKSRSHIANTMRLNKLPNEIKTLLMQNKISAGHARAITNNENPVELARVIIENNLNVRETEKLIKKLTKDQGKNNTDVKEKKAYNIDLEGIEAQLGETLHMKVKINEVENGFKLSVHCKDVNEFDLIVAKLSSSNLF
jgi:ParB family transcriptional regulator, chromosome partitioning protein